MKPLLFICSFFLLICLCQAQSPTDFSWLQGKWQKQNVKPGSSAFEIWEITSDEIDGIGFTMKEADTVFVENLKILRQRDHYYYVADVAHNPKPTYFKMTEVSAHGFTCENPDHDFPKKISYSLEGDVLNVIISGNGKSIPFNFSKKSD